MKNEAGGAEPQEDLFEDVGYGAFGPDENWAQSGTYVGTGATSFQGWG